jgi:hypothetical protein
MNCRMKPCADAVLILGRRGQTALRLQSEWVTVLRLKLRRREKTISLISNPFTALTCYLVKIATVARPC